jgi:hypothetical protein
MRKKSSIGSNNSCDSGKCVPIKRSSNTTSKLFAPGAKLLVRRAPIMAGLGISASKTFQRPMLQRRAYGKSAEEALQHSSLGPKRRMDGMQKLMARAGRGLAFQLPTAAAKKRSSDTEESESEDEEKEEDAPFEPLEVWKSPHQGGAAKGLTPQTYVYASIFLVEIASACQISLSVFSFCSQYLIVCRKCVRTSTAWKNW